MNQLTSTNKNFTLDVTLMEQVFEMMGFNLTVITPSPSVLVFTGNKPEPHFIAKEIAKELGYKKAENLTRHFREKGLDLLKLTKKNGLDELRSFINNCELPDKKSESLIHPFTPSLLLIPGSSLQEYSLRHATKHKARMVADKLYKILSGSYTVQPELYDGHMLHNHPLCMAIHTEAESLGLGREYSSWHFKYVYKSPYLRTWNYNKKQYNWLNSLMGQKTAIASLWINTGWKYGDKVMLKEAGASKNLTRSNRTVIRVNNPSGSDQYLMVQKEYMKAVDERIQDLMSYGMSEGSAITEVFTSPKLTLQYVLSDKDNLKLLEAIDILHDKGYADEQTKEFYDNHFTKKDKQLFQSGKLKIETKPDLEAEIKKLVSPKTKKLKKANG